MQNTPYYQKTGDLFLTELAIRNEQTDKKILQQLILEGNLEIFWQKCYSILQSELNMKPEAYYERISTMIEAECDGSISTGDLYYLNMHRKRYQAVENLRISMRGVILRTQ